MKWLLLTCTVVGLLTALCAAAQGGALGKWNLSFETQEEGAAAATLWLRQEEGRLVGTWTGRRGPLECEKLSYYDGRLDFDLSIQFEGSRVQLHFQGFVEGDSLTGTLYSARNSDSVKGTRASEPAEEANDP